MGSASLSDFDVLVERGRLDRDHPPANRREVYAVVTDDGARVVVELDRLATTTDTLREGLAERQVPSQAPRAAAARA